MWQVWKQGAQQVYLYWTRRRVIIRCNLNLNVLCFFWYILKLTWYDLVFFSQLICNVLVCFFGTELVFLGI